MEIFGLVFPLLWPVMSGSGWISGWHTLSSTSRKYDIALINHVKVDVMALYLLRDPG